MANTRSPEEIRRALARANRIAETRARQVREEREWYESLSGTTMVHMPPRVQAVDEENNVKRVANYGHLYDARTISCLANPIRGVGDYSL